MIPSEQAHIHVFAVTDAGISGKDNEDSYSVSAYRTDTTPPIYSTLAIVADGIGGHRAGEVASRIGVEHISQFVAASDGLQPDLILKEAIIQASQHIYKAAESNREQEGMGSTCACAWIVGNRLYMATVGDSRIYLLRGNTIQQLSKDHTWVQEAIDNGALTPEEAHEHPNAHVIRRYLGSRHTVVPDFRIRLFVYETDTEAENNQGMTLQPGDCILLCSDGLTDLVEDEEIRNQIQTKKGKKALNDLVALANRRGGHDNITIITMTIPEEPRQAPPLPAETEHKSRPRWSCIVAGIFLVITIAILGGLAWYFNELGTTTPPTATQPSEMEAPLPSIIASPTIEPVFIPLETPTIEIIESPTSTYTVESTASPPPFTLTPWPTNTVAVTP